MWCTNCACEVEADVLEADGFTCCTQCGKVLEEAHFSTDPTFSKTAAGTSQVDGNFVPEGAMGTAALGLASLSRGHRGSRLYGYQADSHEKTLSRGRSELNVLAERLGARPKDELVGAAHRLYKLAVQRNFTRGRKTGQVAGACLYIVCRQENKPYMLLDFSDLLATNVFVLGAVFLQLCKLLRLEHHPIMQRPVDPSLFIPRFADRLQLGNVKSVVSHSALRLLASMKRDWMQTGRRPSGVCGAALYIACTMHGEPRSKKEVIAAVHVGESTLEKRLNEFSTTESGGLTMEEFELHATELEEQQRLELQGPTLDSGGELRCEHKGQNGVTHFALGLCRHCYSEFAAMSGGMSAPGKQPPAFERARKVEKMKAEKMKKEEADEEGKEKGEGGNEEEEEEEEEEGKRVTRSRAARGPGKEKTKTSNLGKLARVDPDLTLIGEEGEGEEEVNLDKEELSEDDDDELGEYINTEDERHLKQQLWEELNRDYLEKKARQEVAEKSAIASREKAVAEAVEAAKVAADAGVEILTLDQGHPPRSNRRRKRTGEGGSSSSSGGGGGDAGGGEAATGTVGDCPEGAEAAARHLLAKKKLSSKINYAALTNLFREEPMQEARAGTGTEAERRQQQREQDQREANQRHMEALREDAHRASSFKKAISGFGVISNPKSRRRRLQVSFAE